MPQNTPRRRASAPVQPIDPVENDAPADDDWLSTGADVDKAVKEAKASSRPRVNEFFFVKGEQEGVVDQHTGRKKAEGSASAYVHFAVNYADEAYKTVIPRITIKENGRYNSYTSPGPDCAIRQATGQNPSLRPVYLLVDHRSYTSQEGKTYVDTVKTWIPAASVMDLVDLAIDNLADALSMDRDDLDITQYKAKVTKSGYKRKSVWSISFVPKEEEYSDEAWERVGMFFLGKDEFDADPDLDEITPDMHAQKVRKLLAPDPRYMLSKGGSYTVPNAPNNPNAGKDDTLPY